MPGVGLRASGGTRQEIKGADVILCIVFNGRRHCARVVRHEYHAFAATLLHLKRIVEARLNELEAKMSLAEDLLEALNHAMFRQQQQIDRLQQDVRALRQQLQQSAPDEFASPGDEIPPHY